MKIKGILLALLFCAGFTVTAAENSAVEKTLIQQQSQLNQLKKQLRTSRGDVGRLNKELTQQQQRHNQRIQQLNAALLAQSEQQNSQITAQNNRIGEVDKKLDDLLQLQQNAQQQTQSTLDSLTQRQQSVIQTLDKRSLAAIVLALAIVLLALLGFLRSNKRIARQQTDFSAGLHNALNRVNTAEEQMVSADRQLADSLAELLNRLATVPAPRKEADEAPSSAEPTLPIKVADEIFRMRKRLAALPTETKGLTPLRKSLERLEAELNEQGYELIDYTGMDFDEGMSLNARVIPADDLESGQRVITKVIKPQINYRGLLNRPADVEVSVG